MNMLWLTASFLCGVATTWLARKTAHALNVVSHPNGIATQHRVPVACLGGAGVGLAILVMTLVAGIFGANEAGPLIPAKIWVPATLFLLIGTIDDLRPLNAPSKMLLQILAATTAAGLGLRWQVTGVALFDTSISIAWFVLLVNAFNVTDVCDGLVGGLAVIMLVFAGAHGGEAWVSLVTIGAVLGFLVFNRPPASIFLGDGGSHLLGFLVAGSLVLAPSGSGPVAWKHVLAATLAAGVVILEVVLLIYSRAKAGIPWWRGSPHHFALRLQALGLSRLATDVIAWTAAIVLCVIAWFLPRVPDAIAIAVAAALTLALAVAGRLLLRREAGR